MVNFHNQIHVHCRTSPIQLSTDGVQESKSSQTSITAFTIKFAECQHVYPIACFRSLNFHKLDCNVYLSHLVDELK